MAIDLPSGGTFTAPNPDYRGSKIRKTNVYTFRLDNSTAWYASTPGVVLIIGIITCLCSLSANDDAYWPIPTIKGFTQAVIRLYLKYWLEVLEILVILALLVVLALRSKTHFMKRKRLIEKVHRFQFLNQQKSSKLERLVQDENFRLGNDLRIDDRRREVYPPRYHVEPQISGSSFPPAAGDPRSSSYAYDYQHQMSRPERPALDGVENHNLRDQKYIDTAALTRYNSILNQLKVDNVGIGENG